MFLVGVFQFFKSVCSVLSSWVIFFYNNEIKCQDEQIIREHFSFVCKLGVRERNSDNVFHVSYLSHFSKLLIAECCCSQHTVYHKCCSLYEMTMLFCLVSIISISMSVLLQS